MKFLIFVFFLFSIIYSSQYIPIPPTQYGLTFGQEPKLHIQAFYDLLCVDSKASNKIVLETLNGVTNLNKKVIFTYNFFPLPYHIYSFKVHQGYFYIIDNLGKDSAEQYIQFVLNNQDRYSQRIWQKFSIEQFMKYFTYQISNVLKNLDSTAFYKSLQPGSVQDLRCRAEWKYAAGTLAVSGTPIFYANGVRIDGAQNWKNVQWSQFLKKYI